MKSLILLSVAVICVVTIFVKADQIAQSKNVTASLKIPQDCFCYEIYDPICANDGYEYPNSCFLNCARRENPALLGVCVGECPCCKPAYQNEPIEQTGWGLPLTEMTNGGGWGMGPWMGQPPPPSPYKSEVVQQKEDDEKKIDGARISKLPSSNTNACICTTIYRPVCGSNNQTYGNLCELNCAAKSSNEHCLSLACDGECPCCSCNQAVVYSQSQSERN